MISKVIEAIVKEHVVGTTANAELIDFLEKQLEGIGYSIQSLPFDCTIWEKGKSTLVTNNQSFYISRYTVLSGSIS